MHIPRLKVWKLGEPNVKQEFARLVTDRKDEVFEADNVESKWNAVGWTEPSTRRISGSQMNSLVEISPILDAQTRLQMSQVKPRSGDS